MFGRSHPALSLHKHDPNAGGVRNKSWFVTPPVPCWTAAGAYRSRKASLACTTLRLDCPSQVPRDLVHLCELLRRKSRPAFERVIECAYFRITEKEGRFGEGNFV